MNMQDVIGEAVVDYVKQSVMTPGMIDFDLEEGRESKVMLDLTSFVLPLGLPSRCEIHVTLNKPGLPPAARPNAGKAILVPVHLAYMTFDGNVSLTFRGTNKDNTICFINIITAPDNYISSQHGPPPVIGDVFWALVEFGVFNQGENYER